MHHTPRQLGVPTVHNTDKYIWLAPLLSCQCLHCHTSLRNHHFWRHKNKTNGTSHNTCSQGRDLNLPFALSPLDPSSGVGGMWSNREVVAGPSGAFPWCQRPLREEQWRGREREIWYTLSATCWPTHLWIHPLSLVGNITSIYIYIDTENTHTLQSKPGGLSINRGDIILNQVPPNLAFLF